LIQWHTFTDYGDLYIEDYDFLGDLFIEVFPEGVYIYAPYGVWKVTGSVPVVTSSTTTTTHYSLSNDKVIYETDGTYEIYYTYDYDGTLISFNYDNNINDAIVGNEYFYIKNQQGDITALVNSQGIIQVEYRYDAWGNIIYINTPSGSTLDPSINPYTYRGYRYDGEIGFYYCNSRYYNPEWGRWLNADSVNYLDPSSTNGVNLYAYCGNNSIMGYDPNGTFFITIGVLLVIAKVVATLVVIAAVAATMHDVYQLSLGGDISATATDSPYDDDEVNDNVTINNSYKILTPWMQYGYSFYLNHINKKTKNVICGSTAGVQYEWELHNIANYLGIGDKEQSASVDVGNTIFADSHGGFMGNAMKISYLARNPICWMVDILVNGGYGE
jgi:RHS repeat-associated protein